MWKKPDSLGNSTDPNSRGIFDDIARISDDDARDEATRLLK